mgnify:CR=1 FL=1
MYRRIFEMSFRKVNEDDILRDLLTCREDYLLGYTTEEDKDYEIYIDEISEKILKHVPKQNKKYVKKQLEKLDENILDYLCYWNEKFYRNGFVDGVQIIMGCFEE